jgi:hypothetical protein
MSIVADHDSWIAGSPDRLLRAEPIDVGQYSYVAEFSFCLDGNLYTLHFGPVLIPINAIEWRRDDASINDPHLSRELDLHRAGRKHWRRFLNRFGKDLEQTRELPMRGASKLIKRLLR